VEFLSALEVEFDLIETFLKKVNVWLRFLFSSQVFQVIKR